LGGTNAEATDTCRALIDQQPDLSPARVLFAFMLYLQGKLQEAEQTAAAGLNTPDAIPYLYYMHAVLLLKLDSKQYDQMMQDLRLALRSMPNCTLCYVALGKIHERLGELNAATAELERAVALNPSFAEAWYRLASVYQHAGRPLDAAQARERFSQLKEDRTDREIDMMQKEIFRTLGEASSPQKSP
jgi:tetratricopeptide (TPR) repeat protein